MGWDPTPVKCLRWAWEKSSSGSLHRGELGRQSLYHLQRKHCLNPHDRLLYYTWQLSIAWSCQTAWKWAVAQCFSRSSAWALLVYFYRLRFSLKYREIWHSNLGPPQLATSDPDPCWACSDWNCTAAWTLQSLFQDRSPSLKESSSCHYCRLRFYLSYQRSCQIQRNH